MARKGQTKKVHAGTYVHDEAYAGGQHDLGPWIETPQSTRVARFRFDYLNRAIQVEWPNPNMGYIYLDADYETFRAMVRAKSKGKFINRRLNALDYRPMDPDEADAPSNRQGGLGT